MLERTKNVGRRLERSDLEQLFISAVDETKKRFVHRRLTTELNSASARKTQRAPHEVDSVLHRLTELAKDKVKVEDLTGRDKQGLLELFVENEEVWLKMFDMTFPKTVSASQEDKVAMSVSQ